MRQPPPFRGESLVATPCLPLSFCFFLSHCLFLPVSHSRPIFLSAPAHHSLFVSPGTCCPRGQKPGRWEWGGASAPSLSGESLVATPRLPLSFCFFLSRCFSLSVSHSRGGDMEERSGVGVSHSRVGDLFLSPSLPLSPPHCPLYVSLCPPTFKIDGCIGLVVLVSSHEAATFQGGADHFRGRVAR